ncbi:helix-turn-helix domain-containing protein [Microbacterium sp. NPDC057944]|uniref:AraC family transcriptional regulator n=1 Tax=Microbacterium sp. NPDC057944 TaxID=3346286 RepID=UPI0036DC3B07
MDFQFVGAETAASTPLISEYLESANFRITRLSTDSSLRGRIAQFPELTFAHVSIPSAEIVWPRDAFSTDRALVFIVLSGSASITSPGRVIGRASPDGPLFFVPPGDKRVDIVLDAPRNDLFYVSIDASLIPDVPVTRVTNPQWSKQESEVLAPLLSFSARLCALSDMPAIDVGPLQGAAEEVARAMARLIAGPVSESKTIYDLAVAVIARDCAEARLDTALLAERLGVSSRTLQVAFQHNGVAVASELRRARVRLALQLRRANPVMTSAAIAKAAGFGSTDSFSRAMKRFGEVLTDD